MKLNLIPMPNHVDLNKFSPINIEIGFNITTLKQEQFRDAVKEVLAINRISFNKKGIPIKFYETNLNDEAYNLKITEDEIAISAKSYAGFYYALVTIKQLVLYNEFGVMEIDDKPKYSYRSFLIDSCRHFVPIEEIYRFIDLISELKINKLHFHLTDDPGWRMEILSHPEIAKIGSSRTLSMTANTNQKQEYPPNGYYTQAELRELIKYASAKNVEIIPEIDMPAHTLSLLSAHPELACFPNEFKPAEKAGIHQEILCPGNDATLVLMKEIIQEVIDLFPSKDIHIGADEVIQTKWMKCPKCRAKAKEFNLKNGQELLNWFMDQMVEFVIANGRQPIVWSESMADNNISHKVDFTYWMDMKTMREEAILAAQTRNVIDMNFKYNYFDYPIGVPTLKDTYEYETIFPTNVRGLGSALWTEFVANGEVANAKTFPRIFAFAENAWTQQENKNYENFKATVLNFADDYKTKGVIIKEIPEWEIATKQAKKARRQFVIPVVTKPKNLVNISQMFLAKKKTFK